MEYRSLGNTGLKVSVLGIGVEHLKNQSVESIALVIQEAVGLGINYYDLVWNFPNVIEGVAEGIADSRDEANLAVHLGSCYREGKYVKSRTPRRCEAVFRESLERLDAERVIINVHYIRNLKEWSQVTKSGGILDLALRLRDEGLGSMVALSTHDYRVVELAADHPEIGSVMYPLNMVNHGLEGRDLALQRCKETGTGVVAMKPYARGMLLRAGRTVDLSAFHTGGLKRKQKIPQSNTTARCLSYVLSQPGVSCAVAGIKNVEELIGGVAYVEASETERDYGKELAALHRE